VFIHILIVSSLHFTSLHKKNSSLVIDVMNALKTHSIANTKLNVLRFIVSS